MCSFVWRNYWMHMFELVFSSMYVLVLGDWYGTGGGSDPSGPSK